MPRGAFYIKRMKSDLSHQNNENAKITEVHKFDKEECILNQETCGEIIIAGFGSSDCKNKCKSHLKYLG